QGEATAHGAAWRGDVTAPRGRQPSSGSGTVPRLPNTSMEPTRVSGTTEPSDPVGEGSGSGSSSGSRVHLTAGQPLMSGRASPRQCVPSSKPRSTCAPPG